MRRLLSWCGCLALLVSGGCAICASPYDDQYAAYGGRRQRTDMVHGRVASAFDPAPEVIQGGADGQSPPLVVPGDAVPGRKPAEPSVPGVPDVPSDERAPAESTLPTLPDGTLELPELEPSQLPEFDDSAPPGTLPPDLTGSGERSAKRHPLHDLFDNER